MRRALLTPRWIALHALAVLLVVAFALLGWWQLRRGIDGNLRSFAYALEWPAFALFVMIMWWRMVRDELRGPSGGQAERRSDADPADAEPEPERVWEPPRTVRPAPAGLDPDAAPDAELAAYNRYLADLDAAAKQRRR